MKILVPERFMAYPEFREDARAFLELSEEKYAHLRKAVAAAGSFRVDADEASALSSALEVDEPKCTALVAVAGILYDGVRDFEGSKEDVGRAFEQLATRVDASVRAPEALAKLLEPIPDVDVEAARRQAIRIAPNLLDAELYCDLRVTTDRAGSPAGYVPVVMVRLEFDEPVCGQQGLLVQLTEDVLDNLADKLVETQSTLSKAKARVAEDVLDSGVRKESD